MHKGFRYAFLLAAGVAIPVLTNGCSAVSDAQNGLCCKGFEPGMDMSTPADRFGTLDVSVQGRFLALAQASGDLSAVASGAVSDVTNACRSIAIDMGADPADPSTAGKADVALLSAWCDLAFAKISDITAKATLTVAFDPPQCSASVSAVANCQAKCDVSGKCDVNVTPPKCTGGTLEISCSGSCQGTVQAPTIDCTGSCSGNCSGSCEAQANVAVDCDGKCEGTCAAGGTLMGSGIQSDGSCKGTCQGKCTVRGGATVKCGGTCSGTCDLKCSASPGQASVKCSGGCDAKSTPLECKGGKLEGGCQVDANCQANCNASVQAKAECTPGQVKIAYSGGAGIEGKVNALVATLEKNLPALIVVVQARAKQFADAVAATTGAVDVIADGKLSASAKLCGVPMSLAVVQAGQDMAGAAAGSVKITGAVGIK